MTRVVVRGEPRARGDPSPSMFEIGYGGPFRGTTRDDRGAPRLRRGVTRVALRGEPRARGEPSPSMFEIGYGGPFRGPPCSQSQEELVGMLEAADDVGGEARAVGAVGD